MQPPGSLRSRCVSAHCLEKPTPPTPVPEPPRMGILDLLVWTACVAVYLGLWMTLEGSTFLLPEAEGRLRVAKAVLYAIGWGTALSGVVLMMARSYRGFPYPVYPGEYLLVVMGLDVAIRLTISILLAILLLWWTPGYGSEYALGALQFLAAFGLYAWVFVWAVTRVRMQRWRVLFLAIPASYALWLLLLYGGFGERLTATCVPRLLIATVVTAVVLMDLVDRRRYPWTHWLGVGTRLWLDGSAVGCAVWSALFGP